MMINGNRMHLVFLLICYGVVACASYPSGPREPQAGADQYSVAEDEYLVVSAKNGILVNDKPREGLDIILLTLGEVQTEKNGTIVLEEDGGFTYQPAEDFNGTDRVNYTIKNEKGKTKEGVITFDVSSLPDAPKPVEDRTEVSGGASVTIDVLANDVEPDGEAMQLVDVGRPLSGTAALTEDGRIVYTAAANHSGIVMFSYTVSDVNGLTAVGWVFVTLTNVNNGIALGPDSINSLEDNPVIILLSTLLENDQELSTGAPLTITELGPAQKGTAVLNGDGSLTYTPNVDFFGTDTFTYMVQSPSGNTASTTVTVEVASVADAPTISAIDDQTIAEDSATPPLAIRISDAETPAAALTLSGASTNQALVPNGNIVFEGAGGERTVIVTPVHNQFGSTRITISVSDGESVNATAFNLTVTPVEDPITISDITDQTFPEDATIGPIGFIADDPDRPGVTLNVTAISSNQALIPDDSITIGGSGINRTVTIQPAANQSGSAIITLTALDENEAPAAQDTFTVTLTPVDDPPTISGIEPVLNMLEDTPPLTLPFTIGDVDSPLEALSVAATSSNPALLPDANVFIGGQGADRTLTVAILPNQFGSATITIAVFDGNTAGNFTIALTVASVNDPPTISPIPNQVISWDLNVAALPNPITVPFTVGDVETPAGDLTLSYTVSQAPQGQAVVFGGSGPDRTITVGPGQMGGDLSVGVTVTDRDGGTATSTFVVTVNPIILPLASNSIASEPLYSILAADEKLSEGETDKLPPLAEPDLYSVVPGETLKISPHNGVLANDRDVMDRSLRVVPINLSGLTLDPDGGFTYTPSDEYTGRKTFTYRVSNGSSGTEAILTLAVGGNRVPEAQADPYVIPTGRFLNITAEQGLLANDHDPDGQALTIVSTGVFGTLFGGEVNILPDGAFDYTAPLNFNGFDSFTYTVTDGEDSNKSIAVISVSP